MSRVHVFSTVSVQCSPVKVICVAAEGMAEEERWLPLESNPEVFNLVESAVRSTTLFQVMNLFLQKLGVPDVWAVQDVWGLEPDLLAMLPTPVLGVMLLFPVNDHYRTAAKVGNIIGTF